MGAEADGDRCLVCGGDAVSVFILADHQRVPVCREHSQEVRAAIMMGADARRVATDMTGRLLGHVRDVIEDAGGKFVADSLESLAKGKAIVFVDPALVAAIHEADKPGCGDYGMKADALRSDLVRDVLEQVDPLAEMRASNAVWNARAPVANWIQIRNLARKAVERDGWCPVCECTIGNGSVAHGETCPLFDAGDETA